ncbi:MAG: glycosyltransferase family 4 protein [Pseudomonadota bacterium]
MTPPHDVLPKSARILHCLRAPVGGLFRHVRDLARAQAARGYDVGVLCDAATGDGLTADHLAALERDLPLGVHRIAMARQPGLSDLAAIRAALAHARAIEATILHGHGAKGGAYARLAAQRLRQRHAQAAHAFYTPHGGALHYKPGTLKGRVFQALERHLARHTDGILFESAYARDTYHASIGVPACASRVVPNGLGDADFVAHAPRADAAPFLFLGELRQLKGVDILLHALATLTAQARAASNPLPRTIIVGEGPEAGTFHAQATALGLDDVVTFTGAQPARAMFDAAHLFVMPSRAESLPYIVLEAAAAGMPIITTDVGGIPEITGTSGTTLVPAGNATALAEAMQRHLDAPASALKAAATLKDHVASRFTVRAMTNGVLAFYVDAMRRDAEVSRAPSQAAVDGTDRRPARVR